MTDAIWSLIESTESRYNTDDVIVLGKGPSADRIDPTFFAGRLVIGLNDAERIYPADISIFHDTWAAESIKDAGFRSKAYLTSIDFDAPGCEVIKVPFEPLQNDEADLMLSRFQDRDDVAIEEMMILTALWLARRVADKRQQRQKVYLIGFDFDPDAGYARAAMTSFGPPLSGGREASISVQADVLRNAMYALEGSQLEVLHVGDVPGLSTVDPSELGAHRARLTPRQAPQAPIQPAPNAPKVEITAEITTNHFGDRERLETMVRAAHAAGADWVKVQKRDVDSFYSAKQLATPYTSPFGTTFGEYRRALELDREDFEFLDDLCSRLGIGWFASVLDEPSFRFITDLGAPLIKLPSTISEHMDYLSHVAETYTGALVLSTGMTDTSYEKWVLETFKRQETLYLLHCNSAYPTPDAHCNIGVVRHYAELAATHPRLVPGYSSHDFGWMASALAVAAGARMVEKHVKLGHTEWAHFDAVAVDLNTSGFREYVDHVRLAQTFVGSSEKQITQSEHHKYYKTTS